MTQLDQFESVFKAASKEAFHFASVDIEKVMVITDLDATDAAQWATSVEGFLSVLRSDGKGPSWKVLSDSDYDSVEAIQRAVQEESPDLVCTYRNLKSDAWRWPYSLGAYANALVRTVAPPVLLLPHPKVDRQKDWTLINTDRVLVVTDHLAGDDRLVNYGVRFCEEKGALFLAHIEDDVVFERYMRAIEKLPAIDTEIARTQIKHQLLREAHDFVVQCRAIIAKHRPSIHVDEVVELGHQVAHYKQIVEKHQVDLLILHGDDVQHEIAMHGVAYALTVELTALPILLL